LEHGNGGDPEKDIECCLFGDESAWGVIVSDEGDGFDESDIPPSEGPESLFRERGRGIWILREYMSEVVFYDEGRTVKLIRQAERS
ncbi:MAG: ATP-binding protein, partial [Planctomycetota bacterium]